MGAPLDSSGQPERKSLSLVIGWSVDAGKLGAKVTNYLNRKLGGQSFVEIEPVDFFPLGGVVVEDNIVQFPECKFYLYPEANLIVFRSDPPVYNGCNFVNLILDTISHYYHVKEIYTIGGIVSLSAHTTPRELLGVSNSIEWKTPLSHHDLIFEWDFETPAGQRPTLNSVLLCSAMKRNIPGVSLWAPIPFYLVAVDDHRAHRKVLEFLNRRFSLEIDLSDLDAEIRQQNQLLAEARSRLPRLDASINKLESNLGLSEEASQELVTEIEKFLREQGG